MLAVAGYIQSLESRLAPLRDQLIQHPLYSHIQSVEGLRIFMQSHVFAVWDFMSLLKALQDELTCVRTPWIPRGTRGGDAAARRFINAIVLDEESDLYEGRAVSHFELYVEAMRDCGANTVAIENLLKSLQRGDQLEHAMALAGAPIAAEGFVASTFDLIGQCKPHAIAAAFTFGREDIIPDLFRGLVRELNIQESGKLSKLIWYLERHIELDGDDHGPLALKLIEDLCDQDQCRWREAESAAEVALQARLALWDGILEQIKTQRA